MGIRIKEAFQGRLLLIAMLLLFGIVLASVALAQGDELQLPAGIQKIIEHNNQQASDFAVKISFFIAFAAGMLGILSPCILPFLPAYFSYTFKEKKNITKMTLVFFIGFSLVFVIMGAVAGFIGEQSLAVIQNEWLVMIAGLFLVALGVMSLAGKGFSSFIRFDHRFSNDVPGVFLFGVSFAVGWTACLGPILAGILGIGAILHNALYSAALMLFYSLGNLVPLFILSVFYDKMDLSKSRFIRGKMLSFSILGKKLDVHSTNLISGLLFIVIGLFFVIYKNTAKINTFDIFGTRQYFYSVQNMLIGWKYANAFSAAVFIIFILALGFFLLKKKARVKIGHENKI